MADQPENALVVNTETVNAARETVNLGLPSVSTLSSSATPTNSSSLSNTEAVPSPSATSTIRNFVQTAQEREIIKTAPDIVVYFDGLPYLINSYLNDPTSKQEFVLVNFNDHVQSFNASFDTDNLKPHASINLSVPNHLKYLYQSPGGNNLLISMMEVQVFAKGYYPSKRGNTLYHRVFKGLSSHITHTDNGKTLEIQVQCSGILRFLEMMQMDTKVAAISNSPHSVTGMQTDQWNLDPYEQIADTFLRGMNLEGFQLNTVAGKGQTMAGSDFNRAVQADYVVKWQSILNSIRKDTHVMGYTGNILAEDINSVTKDSQKIGVLDRDLAAEAFRKTSPTAESNSAIRDKYVSLVRGYTPDFRVTQIQLVNGSIVSRLERIRAILHNIGFEGYQDVNGEIIFKAPLYNLDVTNLAPAPSNDDVSPSTAANDLSEENNPFVVHLAEILAESENEDEGAIQATRMSIQGTYSRGVQVDVSNTVKPVGSHIDIPKLARFGLREAPAKTVPWVDVADKYIIYTYAVNELVRANRGWRTYSLTIPMRPELRLGFPMYIAHKDMFGYIKSVTINYQISGAATMSIMLDTIRKRPMFPSQRPTKGVDESGNTKSETLLTTQPNLVMKWTKPPGGGNPLAGTGFDVPTLGTGTSTANSSASGDVCSNDPEVNLVGNPATQVHPEQEPMYDEQLRMAHYRKEQIGTDWQTRADTKTRCFRVQKDSESEEDSKTSKVGKDQPFFSRERWLAPRAGSSVTGIDAVYFQRILTMQPYTDEHGYEVVGVFPLGRWKSLPEAYKETREGKIVDYVNPQDQVLITGTKAFLFAGLGLPSSDSASILKEALDSLKKTAGSDSSFELSYQSAGQSPQFGPQPADSNLLKFQQPDSKPGSDAYLLHQTEEEIQNKVKLFITGTPPVSPQTKQELQVAKDNAAANADFSNELSNFNLLKP